MAQHGGDDFFAEQFVLLPDKQNETTQPPVLSPAWHSPDQQSHLKGKDKKSQKLRTKKHYEGHRERLRQRFLATAGDGLADYELLELILFRSIARADTKPLAKALLAQFGSLADVLGADLKQLQQVPGCGQAVATDLKMIATLVGRCHKAALRGRDIFSSWDTVLAYCQSVMAHERREQFRILFLDKKNGLIADEIHQTGTVDHTPVYPREVMTRALELGASSLILVHNHPSGDPSPSRQDIAMTLQLIEVAQGLNIKILDHLIIGRNGTSSLKQLNLM